MKSPNIKQKIKEHFIMFLAKEINPPPFLFFTLYVYCHLQIQSPAYIAYSFFTIGLIFTLLFSYNHFYIYSPVLNGGIGYLSILNLGLGLLAANQKWKLYLYLFIIGDSVTMEYPEISKLYTICCSFYICIEIYKHMIFKIVRDNIIYFVGFSTIFVFELFRKLIDSAEGYSSISYFVVPFAILIAYKLIKNRIEKLKKEDITKLRNVELIQHYVELIQEEIKSPYSREGLIQTHRENCSSVDCFCRNRQIAPDSGEQSVKIKFKTKVEYFFIRSLYEKALKLKSLSKREFLYNKFIDFLIENNQITEAIEKYTKLDTLEQNFFYFMWVQRARLYFKIRDKLEEFDYFNVFSQEFEYVFKYDLSYLHLASEIKEILQKKVQFWKEVGRETPLMIKLQQLGSEIVQKMYQLNNYYYKDIKSQEEKINNFNGTIMYAMYLLSTTNYKEYAESLIKNTSRALESIKIHEDNIAETYGVKVFIRDSKKSCNQKIQPIEQIIDSSELQKFIQNGVQCHSSLLLQKEQRENSKRLVKFYQDGFIQTISNVSGSLCKLLKTSKNDMLGKDLNIIIPASYQQKHHQKLGRLVQSDSLSNKQIVNLSFINKIREVPLKTTDKKLINAKISVKIFEGIEEGISFIALLQTINDNKITFITNIEGEVQEYEEGLKSLRILECKQISETLKDLKEEWNMLSKISTRKISVVYMENNYSITFTSPYQYLFLNRKMDSQDGVGEQEGESKALFNKTIDESIFSPPIHIDIINESIPHQMNPRPKKEQEMTKCIKKMESVFNKTDIDSQASTTSSKKSSVVNVLMSFSENYFIPFYGYIMAVFLLIVIGSIVANGIAYSKLGLEWDNTQRVKNPIINIISVMDIRAFMIFTINHQMDLIQYRTNPLINKTNVNAFYALDKTEYPTYVRETLNRTKNRYKQSVSSISMYLSQLLQTKLDTFWSQLIPTTNPNITDPDKRTQNIKLLDVFMHYFVDLDLLSQGRPYQITVMSLNFWSTVEYIISKITALNSVVTDSIDKTIMLNYIYCSIMIAIIVLTVLPIYVFLKKRVKKHIDIYDLIVSVQGELVHQEIKKLDSIINIVNKSNESSEVLKTNTINYLARKRSAAINDGVGANNEMIQGLIQTQNDSITQGESALIGGQQTKSILLAEKSSKVQNYISSKYQDQIVEEQSKKFTLRKRSGQLDLKGSEGDFKRVVFKHWILYIIVLLNSVALLMTTAQKTGYYETVIHSYETIEKQYSNFIEQALLMLNAKCFFRGLPTVDFQYHEQNYIAYMDKTIYANKPVLFDSRFYPERIQTACTGKLDKKYLLCQKNFSLITLRQQFTQFVKESYELRQSLNKKYNISSTNQTSVPKQELHVMSEYFFYVMSIRDRMANMSHGYKNTMITQIFEGQVQLDSKINSIFVVGISLGVFSLLLGLFFVNYMKKLYFKEIIIVSFLNNQMISKNKRVESFLQTLSKSSY